MNRSLENFWRTLVGLLSAVGSSTISISLSGGDSRLMRLVDLPSSYSASSASLARFLPFAFVAGPELLPAAERLVEDVPFVAPARDDAILSSERR